MTYFLDTNICIYFLKGLHPTIRSKLQALKPRDVKVPAMVMAELLFGAEHSKRVKQNRDAVIRFLAPYEVVPFDTAAAEQYAKVRSHLFSSGRPAGPNDLIIASIVLTRQGTLVTHNQAEFKRIKRLKVIDWV